VEWDWERDWAGERLDVTREEERSGEGEVGEKRRGKNSREREGGEKKSVEREKRFLLTHFVVAFKLVCLRMLLPST
jgi:hypothetical protein